MRGCVDDALLRGPFDDRVEPGGGMGGSGGTAFHVREEYSGPLLGLIWRSMPDLGPSFDRFAQGLKRRVEAGR
jgi:hypothetical protein